MLASDDISSASFYSVEVKVLLIDHLTSHIELFGGICWHIRWVLLGMSVGILKGQSIVGLAASWLGLLQLKGGVYLLLGFVRQRDHAK